MSTPISTPISARNNVVELRGRSDRFIKVYVYRDAFGEPVGEKGRFESDDGSKRFSWRKPGVEGWPSGPSDLKMADLPLYNTHLLVEHPNDPVYFVEGEKAADVCVDQGLLAVTGAGGASQRSFGSALDPLRGKSVFLWADNDAPGAAYMAYVRAQLTVMGCKVLQVSVALPPKGDAADYFRAGGTIAGLDVLDPRQPVVSIEGDESVRVVVTTAEGPVTFLFENMEKNRSTFKCELTVSCFKHEDPYVEQLNLNSNNGTTTLRRDLDKVFGEGYEWTKTLNKVFGLARDAYLNIERGFDVEDLPDSMGEVLLVDPLLANGPTIFFGDGASLKSYISAMIAVCMALGVEFCHMPVPHLVPMVIDWEDEGPNFRRRLQRLFDGLGAGSAMGVHYWNAKGIPLADQVDALKRYITKHGIGLLVIDSVAPACGGDPLDHSAVLDFFRALKRLELPSILVAHVTKQMENTKPFGSAYWHNEARRTWWVTRATEEDSDEVDVGFFNRKVNDGRIPKPFAFHVSFSPDLRGPVTVELGSMESAPTELQDHRSIRDRVWAELTQPRTIPDLAESLGATHDSVKKVLQRGPFVVAGTTQTSKGGRSLQLWARTVQPGLSGQTGQFRDGVERGVPKPLFHD